MTVDMIVLISYIKHYLLILIHIFYLNITDLFNFIDVKIFIDIIRKIFNYIYFLNNLRF